MGKKKQEIESDPSPPPPPRRQAGMYAPTPSSIGGGGRMPPSHQEFVNNHSGRHASGGTATAAVPWDSDRVAYVGMEYSNKGACSQKRSAAVDFYAGGGTATTGRGCSQNKAAAPAAYLNMNSDGSIRESSWFRRPAVYRPVPRIACVLSCQGCWRLRP